MVIFPKFGEKLSLCSSCYEDFEEYYPIENAIWINLVYASLFFVFFLYFDSVIPNESGIRKDCLFFINWMWKNKKTQVLSINSREEEKQ